MSTKTKIRGSSCSVVGCRSARGRDPVSFFRYPGRNLEQRQLWIRAVNRLDKDGHTPWTPGKHALVCGKHFVRNKPSPTNRHPDYVPSIFPTKHVKAATLADVERFDRSLKRRFGPREVRPIGRRAGSKGCVSVNKSAETVVRIHMCRLRRLPKFYVLRLSLFFQASDEVIPEDVLHEDTPDEPSQVQEGNDADPVVQEQGNFDEQNGSLDDDLEEDVDGEEDSSEANKRQNESEEDNFQDHDPLQGNNLSERTMEETFEVYVNKNENVAVKDPFDSENEQDEEDLQDTDLNAETENNGFNSEASECDDGQENCDEPETNVNEGESTDPLSDPLDGLDLEVTEEDVDPYANARRDDQVVTKNKKKAQHKSPAPPEEASTKATEDTITLSMIS